MYKMILLKRLQSNITPYQPNLIPSVKFVDLTRTGIDASALEILGKGISSSSSFIHLKLAENQMHSKEAEVMSRILTCSSKLLGLDLSNNFFSQKALNTIAVGLKNNRSLQWLDLSPSRNEMYCYAKLFDAIRTANTIQSLILKHALLDDKNTWALSAGLDSNSSLNRLGIDSFCDPDLFFNSVKANSSLKDLKVLYFQNATLGFKRFLQRNPLKTIDLKCYAFSSSEKDDLFEVLMGCPSIERISLDVDLYKHDLEVLGQLIARTAAKVLKLDNCSIKEDYLEPLLVGLLENDTIKRLSLQNNYLHDQGINQILKTAVQCQKLQYLDLSDNRYFDLTTSLNIWMTMIRKKWKKIPTTLSFVPRQDTFQSNELSLVLSPYEPSMQVEYLDFSKNFLSKKQWVDLSKYLADS